MKAINVLLPMVLSACMLTGCYQSVNLRDIQDAAIICAGLENITEIRAYFDGHEVTECNNRQSYKITANNLKRSLK